MAGLPPREELLAAAWLMSLRSARTRRAYAGDLRAWLAWLAARGVDVLAGAGCTWTCGWLGSWTRRGGVQRAAAPVGAVQLLPLLRRPRPDRPDPAAGVARPVVDPDYTATIGLTESRPAP